MVELSDDVYRQLEAEASAAGTTPAAWIAARLDGRRSSQPDDCAVSGARTLADLFAGRVGLVASDGDGRLAQDAEERFADGLAAQQRAGTL
jgi:hypothetical protein